MFQTITFYHSLVRWLVLLTLICCIVRAIKGYKSNAVFTRADDALRHWTATTAHIQLVIGILIYTQSPIVKYLWKNFSIAIKEKEFWFFGLLHILLMLSAIGVISTGSALAKRRQGDKEKFKTILQWYAAALIIIIVAIPWPFSPFAHRPYFR